ncbi:hypothetical protein TNCV_904741 [Trichonephila clavipes]|nr:hypothetical protein TNCV_904741 [Trichonephila clavipes]
MALFSKASTISLWHSIAFFLWRTAILMRACCSTRVTSNSHDTQQMTDFTDLAELLPAITEQYLVLQHNKPAEPPHDTYAFEIRSHIYKQKNT